MNQIDSKSDIPPDPYFILRGHRTFINSICFDLTNDNLLFSGSGDGEIRLWNVEENRCLKVIQHAHREGGVLSLHSVPNFNTLVSQGRDGTIKVWSLDPTGLSLIDKLETNSISLGKCYPIISNLQAVKNGSPLREHPLPELESLSIAGDSNILGAPLSPPRGQQQQFIPSSPPPPPNTINAHENLVAISSDEVASQIELWDLTQREIVMKLRADQVGNPERHGMSMSMKLWRDPNGSLNLCSGFENGSLCLWDLRNHQQIAVESKLHTEPVLSFALKDNNGVSGSGDNKIAEFNVNFENGTFDKTADHTLNNNGIADVKIRNDGKIYATAGWDRRVRIYNFRKHTPLAILKYHTESIYSIDFSRQNILASASKDMKIALWSIYR